MFVDNHAHLYECDSSQLEILNKSDYSVLTNCSTIDELNHAFKIKEQFPEKVFVCAGSFPQKPDFTFVSQLEYFLSINDERIFAIGECGFDLRKEFRSSIEVQRRLFSLQLQLAVNYQKPIVIHCVKAMNEIFPYADELKKVPLVLFHGFSGSLIEAESIIKKGINAKFSFGKNLLRGDKNSLACVRKLPSSLLLAETDAPYQLSLDEIVKVYELLEK